MATKKRAVSTDAATAFKKALKIRDHREYQLADSKHCLGVGLCPICDQYEELVAVVNTALDVKPWELSPVDVVDAPAPPMWNNREREDWDRARDQHVALANAAKMKPLEKALITDACRGQANIRWVERHGEIPDGPSIGQPFRLLEFQRDVIRGIYADPAYWAAVTTVLKKKERASQQPAGG
jgi:hypothetical protein